jgi:23S rRNA-/tRNA-specific pseudouridylate synthase
VSNCEFSRDRIERSFSSIYHRWLYYSLAQIPGTLFETLAINLAHIDREQIAQRVAWGGVFINGLEVNVDQPLPVPCKLEYYEPRFELDRAQEFFPQWNDNLVLFEDEFLIALFKPAKLPSIPGKEQKYFNLKSYVEKYCGTSIHMPSRLDMSTSGLILMSKNQKTHKSLQHIYEYGSIKKAYLLASDAKPLWSKYDERGAIGKDLRHPVLRTVVEQGGKTARTIFSRLNLATADHSTICLAQPLSGRTHQIRVHAAHLHIPIIGDNFYSGAPASGLRLMAYGLSFRHPQGGARLEIRVPEHYFPEWLPGAVICEVEPILSEAPISPL